MMLARSTHCETRWGGRPRRRKGVVLLVVLALLTLFEIVGISFVTYSGTVKTPALREQFSDDAHDLAFHSLALAKKIQPFLVNMLQGEPDDPEGVYSAIRGYEERLEALTRRVRLALAEEENPRNRERLTDLLRDLDTIQEKVNCLRCAIDEILRG